MCGIVGLISRKVGGLWHTDLDMFRHMLVVDTVRGMDATGAFSVMRNNEVQILKVGSHPLHLFQCTQWNEFQNATVQRGSIIIGHNRSATKGALSSENAHPFHENGIIMVHNGTLRGDHKKEHGDREVDSHALCLAFSEKGHEAVLPTIDGAFALVWWDKARGSLFAIRNDERPLTLTITADMIAIASEAWMPQVGFARQTMKPKVEDSFTLKAGDLYEFKPGGTYTVKSIKLKEDDYDYSAYRSGKDTTYSAQVKRQHTTTTAATTTTSSAPDAKTLMERDARGNLLLNAPPNETAAEEVERVLGTAAVRPTTPLKDLFRDRMDDVLPNTVKELFPNPHYPVGATVAVTFNKAQTLGNGKVRLTGHTAMPGKPQESVSAIVTSSGTPSAISRWYEGTPVGIVSSVTSTTCGLTLNLREARIEEAVSLHNNREISLTAWEQIHKNCVCVECKMHIGASENIVTAVREDKTGFRIFCADCVEAKLPSGEISNEFKRNRDLTLQTDQPIRQDFSNNVINIGGPSCTAGTC